MQFATLSLLIAMVCAVAQCQLWAGSYTPDSSCDRSSCCCLNNRAVLTNLSSNTFNVTSGLNGVCGSQSTFTSVVYTSGFNGWMIALGINFTATLSADSSTITVINPVDRECSGVGVKGGAVVQHGSIVMLLVSSLIGLAAHISAAWNISILKTNASFFIWSLPRLLLSVLSLSRIKWVFPNPNTFPSWTMKRLCKVFR